MRHVFVLAALAWPALLQAAAVERFTPTGSSRDVQQAVARFSEPMQALGDATAAAPYDVDCPTAGQGRWIDDRQWAYDFIEPLPAGLRCRFTLKPGLTTRSGAPITGTRDFAFDTGGPAIRRSLPADGDRSVDSAAIFLLMLDASATAASVAEHGYCSADNLAERLPLQVLQGTEREAVLSQRRALGYRYYELLRDEQDQDWNPMPASERERRERRLLVVRCARPLPEDTDVALTWGAGIRSASGVATTHDQVLKLRTRAPFTASLGCDRVNANAPCVPVLPLHLSFSAPVTAQQARQIRLVGPDFERAARWDEPDSGGPVERLRFDAPLPEGAQLQLQLPADLRDDAGRPLANAGSFPLAVVTDQAPPLVKFSGEFGILESKLGGVLPLSLRDVEPAVAAQRIGGTRRRIDDEAEVLRWIARVRQRMSPQWADDKPVPPGVESVFAGAGDDANGAQAFELTRPAGGKAFELIGIPLTEPGFHVVELASPRLGAALLGKPATRYVATTALVTNLAVHFKWGRESSLAFVTTLDGARPVAAAQVRVVDGCDGRALWNGVSDANGIARIDDVLPKPASWGDCSGDDGHPLMVSARADGDFSFVLSSWSEGISPGDFGFDSGLWSAPQIGHAVLDRRLFRAGETVSMKHYWRQHTRSGIVIGQQAPTALVIAHAGSDERVTLPLQFDAQGIAESRWAIPASARLGQYQLSYQRGDEALGDGGSFRVEQYRVPLMRAMLQAPAEPAVARRELPLDLYVGYFSGGGAGGLRVKLRTQLQVRTPEFDGYEGYRFDAQPIEPGIRDESDTGLFPDANEADSGSAASRANRTLPLTLDANGAARAVVDALPADDTPQTLIAELEYPDANGELTSVRNSTALWPSSLVVGIATTTNGAAPGRVPVEAVVLGLDGRPLRGRKVDVTLYQVKQHAYRKRLVGGFYTYSQSSETIRLDAGCSARSDAQGLVRCTLTPGVSGMLLIEARAADDQRRVARAVDTRWLAGADDTWFTQGDSDRMDLVAERRQVEPGESIRLQARMPFRHATALVTVEREGVIDAFVTELSGRDPVVTIPALDRYAPNVYVSVLALRPRVGDFRSRFYRFLRWLGLDRWLTLDGDSPTATTDLSRPAFRIGMAAVDVGWAAHRLDVQVKPGSDTYQTRDTARVDVQVKPSDGSALPAQAEIAFTAVDEALLDLLPNDSVDLLGAMMQRRGYEVLTSTAQTQVVGKRHYGRKALAPGGGGGRGAAREQLDSLLLWKGRVALDAQGHAHIDVPLNDALTGFRLTAVASAGADRFGTGHASIRTTQDLQLLSGLPPLVREGDRFDAVFTLRNTTARALSLRVDAQVGADVGAPMPPQRVDIDVAANSAAPARFRIEAPAGVDHLQWQVSARPRDAAADATPLDALKVSQIVAPSTPVRVTQAALLGINDGRLKLPVATPPGALTGRDGVALGGLRIGLSPSLTAGLDASRDWMRDYPYACAEQRASRAVALGDRAQWDAFASELPRYIDRQGLLRYFPSSALDGDAELTAYLLQLASESGWTLPDDLQSQLLSGLRRQLDGRVSTVGMSRGISDAIRLQSIEALSRYQMARAADLTTLPGDPSLWSSGMLVDYLSALQRIDDAPSRNQRLARAKQLLRARFNVQGTVTTLSAVGGDASRRPLLTSDDSVALRALLALLPEADARDELPALIRGALQRQHAGRWDLTTANAWGALALQGFAARYERGRVDGRTSATLDGQQADQRWAAAPQGAALDLAWPAAASTLQLSHDGGGAPWALVQSRAALPRREPFSSGYRITRTLTPVDQQVAGRWTRGDVARVRLEVDAQADMRWVVVDDPIPGGSTLLGTGLGRDPALVAGDGGASSASRVWPAFEERRFDAYRAYYAFVPKGRFQIEYTVRFNTSGHFSMPPTHVEAMYAPEMLGELPIDALDVAGDAAPAD